MSNKYKVSHQELDHLLNEYDDDKIEQILNKDKKSNKHRVENEQETFERKDREDSKKFKDIKRKRSF